MGKGKVFILLGFMLSEKGAEKTWWGGGGVGSKHVKGEIKNQLQKFRQLGLIS